MLTVVTWIDEPVRLQRGHHAARPACRAPCRRGTAGPPPGTARTTPTGRRPVPRVSTTSQVTTAARRDGRDELVHVAQRPALRRDAAQHDRDELQPGAEDDQRDAHPAHALGRRPRGASAGGGSRRRTRAGWPVAVGRRPTQWRPPSADLRRTDRRPAARRARCRGAGARTPSRAAPSRRRRRRPRPCRSGRCRAASCTSISVSSRAEQVRPEAVELLAVPRPVGAGEPADLDDRTAARRRAAG